MMAPSPQKRTQKNNFLLALLGVVGLAAAALLFFEVLIPSFPSVPRWVFFGIALAVIIVLMLFTQRRFPQFQPWAYLMPAILFLFAFTLYPLGMTLFYSFTNFSSVNSGRPDSSTQSQVRRIDEHRLELAASDLTRLRCEAADCAGQKIELRDSQTESLLGKIYTVISLSGNTLTIRESLPASFEPDLARKVSTVSLIGTKNFREIIKTSGRQLGPVLGWNIFFALFTTFFNVVAGILMGVLLNNKRLRFRNVYRSLLFLPWAIPAVISIQMWQTLFNTNFGAMNRLAGIFGFAPAPWLDDPTWAKAAILLVNLWLSFPYFMTATIGALTTIPEELYEAAEVDGASPWQRFAFITVPGLRQPFIPIILASFASSFNNIILIFLLTGGKPVQEGRLALAQSTDILLTWAYKTAFQSDGGQNYGIASAIAVVVGLITVILSLINFRVAGTFDEGNEFSLTKRDSARKSVSLAGLGWMGIATMIATTIWAGFQLHARLRPRSFAVLYPENGLKYALLGIVGLTAIIALVSLVSYFAQRKKGKRVGFSNGFSTGLTHVFFWITIVFTLYPAVYVLAASFDPFNRLSQASLGDTTEPLLIRARVLPSLSGMDTSNYAKLVEGVHIFGWQWALLGGGIVCGLLMLIRNLLSRHTEISDSKFWRYVLWVGILAVVVVIASLTPRQFTSPNPSSKFMLWVRNTLLISGSTGLITLALTSTAGYALARLRFAGRLGFLQGMIFLQMFPGLLGLVATYALINTLDLVNTFTGLILAYSGGVIAFGAWIYKGYLETLPPSLDEAAMVDGCNRWQVFTRIILPLTTPALIFLFLLQFIGTYTEFFLANVIVTGAENWNVGVGLRSFSSGQFTVSYGPFAAAAVLGSLPIVVMFYSFQKVFVSGLAGGVKG